MDISSKYIQYTYIDYTTRHVNNHLLTSTYIDQFCPVPRQPPSDRSGVGATGKPARLAPSGCDLGRKGPPPASSDGEARLVNDELLHLVSHGILPIIPND